ncbi:PAS domain-containing protein [Roseobacteraceae bacterium NS-SX3]
MSARPRPGFWQSVRDYRTLLPAFVALVVILAAAVFSERQNEIIHDQNVRADVQNEAGLIRSRLEGRLNANIELVRGLVAVMSTEPDMNQERFSQLAAQMVGAQNDIRHVAAAPDLVISMIYPVAGNEAALGLDYNKIDAQREAAYQVRDSGEMVLAGPVNLVQGGRGFIGRFPIFTGSGADRRFWGLLSAVIDVDGLFAESGITGAGGSIEVALAGQDGKGAEGAVFHGDPAVLEDDPVLMDIHLPQGTWLLAARPKSGWHSPPPNLWRLRAELMTAGALILFPTFLVGRLSAARRAVIRTLKRRERELETLSRRLEMAVETSKIGIWETGGRDGRMIWDRRLRGLYGMSGHQGPVSMDDWCARLHPDDRAYARQAFEAALRHGNQYASEFRIVLPDGRERHIRSLGNTFTDAVGRSRMIGVDLDVSRDVQLREELVQANQKLTERNRELNEGKRALETAHAELQKKQAELQRLSLVAKHASDSIILTDADTRILWVNDAFTKVTGYSAEEAIGSTPADLLNGPRTDEHVIRQIEEHKARGEPFHTEVLNYTKSGEETWIDTNLVPILDENGRVDLIIGIERDITEVKARERELADAKLAAEKADRAKSEFLANMSHEIRTPMNGIMGMAELLAEAGLPPEERQYVETIRHSSDALLKIINDILDLSRLEAGKLAILPADFDLRHCIGGAVDLLRPKARSKGLTLSVSYDDGLPARLRGDDGRLRQILVNLVGNAVKFTSSGGVSVRVGQDAGDPCRLVIEVEDTGIGISASQAAHVFDRFSQADTATTRSFGGTGLGLTISRVLAERMGGGISLRSELGRGSCFRLTVQMAPAAQQPDIQQSGAGVDTSVLAGSRVLLAEDNRTNRLLVQKFLAGIPLDLMEAENGRQAVGLCRAERPDIILMDMSMPELDGISATREIRALDIPQPAIVALTANAFDSDREACLAAGMDRFLQKPINKIRLLQTLAEVQAGRIAAHAVPEAEKSTGTG